MAMTSDEKRALATTIRGLRAHLLEALRAETERVYRLSVRARDAKLSEAAAARRARLEGWCREQVRAQGKTKTVRTEADLLREVEKQAGYTLLNRLILLRLLEAMGHRPPIVTGARDSQGYSDFCEVAPDLARGDETGGYALLLRLTFEDLATELPGLYGSGGVADLIPVDPATLRHTVEELNKHELAGCWTDDMTLGWVYQYWNDPEREALDAKLHARGKLEPHEIASKTQMFTERYMVDWLLQNSLGPLWLAMCQKQGWIPEVQAPKGDEPSVLDALEARRVDWRAKREREEVELTALMPLHSDAERRWAYYLPQPIPEDAVEHAPDSVRDLKILDPAVGSGHFLVVACELLFALYQEEARHRGEADHERWSPAAIVERILGHNLHGIDLDPRAVQIAAAALWLKARELAPGARPARLNLVASDLRLASLPDDDPALVELRRVVERETGIPGELTDQIVAALRGADHLGSLLKIDAAVDQALAEYEDGLSAAEPAQAEFFEAFPEARRKGIPLEVAKANLLGRLETFLSLHSRGDDLGLRLRGEQLAKGVRFLRLVREGTYDLVVGNPPYQSTSKMVDATYAKSHYPTAKADLYAAFLERGSNLSRAGCWSALLTMRGWLSSTTYEDFRSQVAAGWDIRSIGDFGIGAFDEIANDRVSVAASIYRCATPVFESIALQPTPLFDCSYDRMRTPRKRAATLCHAGRYEFDASRFKEISGRPYLYWWSERDFLEYRTAGPISRSGSVVQGISTADDTRFLRFVWELPHKVSRSCRKVHETPATSAGLDYVPLVKGAVYDYWIEPLTYLVRWTNGALGIRTKRGSAFRSPTFHLQPGVACKSIGSLFSARAHRYRSVCHNSGTSIYGLDLAEATVALNSPRMEYFATSLNPGLHFEVQDLLRLPLLPVERGPEVFRAVQIAFEGHEAQREQSVEFRNPGPTTLKGAQDWAAATLADGYTGPYVPRQITPPVSVHLSFAVGQLLGRFGVQGGIREPAEHDIERLVFVDTSLPAGTLLERIGQDHQLASAWENSGLESTGQSLESYLAEVFFETHRLSYEKRPIFWPLSSRSKVFVAIAGIHSWTRATLTLLLADHLTPTLQRLEGELTDVRRALEAAAREESTEAEERLAQLQDWRDELKDFIDKVEQCAERGPPPTHASEEKCKPREQDHRYVMDLDDGVLINSAALWPLLEPQWKDPKKWWTELANAKGKKDYDWSHAAMRYFPDRVDGKCRKDPSLGVAHGCFWRYHPEKAWAWELRLQDEIGPEHRIDEGPYTPGGRDLEDPGSDAHREAFLREQPQAAFAAVEKELKRRMGRGKKKKLVREMRLLEKGLWSALPEAFWELEVALSKKQKVEVKILAPDEPAARAKFVEANPERAQARAELLARLKPDLSLFAGEADA